MNSLLLSLVMLHLIFFLLLGFLPFTISPILRPFQHSQIMPYFTQKSSLVSRHFMSMPKAQPSRLTTTLHMSQKIRTPPSFLGG